MALKGYIASNVYLYISNVIYEKDLCRCTALLNFYSDDSKQILLGNTTVVLQGGSTTPSLISIKPCNALPKNIKDEFFIIGEDAQDNLKGLEGRIARKSKITGELETYYLTNNSFLLYVEDEKKYRQYQNGEWVEKLDMSSDKRLWDKWLAPEVALVDGTNPTRQMYKFIKTLPQFKDCEDC